MKNEGTMTEITSIGSFGSKAGVFFFVFLLNFPFFIFFCNHPNYLKPFMKVQT